MEQYQVKPVIDKVFPFAEYREAYKRLKSVNHVGIIVIDVTH
ncbi:zinc-binding dehydrogenase [Kosakonia cowanii]